MLSLASSVQGQGARCIAHSSPQTTALVELYTSEHCPKCAVAERWLARLGEREPKTAAVVPVALHVDVRAYKRDSQPGGRKLTPRQRIALLHTPRVLLQGREFARWESAKFDSALAEIQSRPARAWLTVEVAPASSGGLPVRVRAELIDGAATAAAALYLGAYEQREHTVVLEWQGPIALSEPRLVEERLLPLLPQAAPMRSGVIAFVQDRRTGEVLQALMRPGC